MRVAVVGGGAAGMLASIFLAKGGAGVVLFEKNDRLGRKLFITGKGRCNLTNDCDREDLFKNIVHGDKFLRSALSGFTPQDAMEYFEGLGLPLVVERGNRVFPQSQKSSDVIRTLERELIRQGVDIRLSTAVASVTKGENSFDIKLKNSSGKISSENFDCVLIATGGVSYPLTGSTGDGYKFAKSFGHKIVEPKQALVALNVKENVSGLQGLSLKNVQLTAFSSGGKQLLSEFGEMMFTREGVTGPIVLTISSYIARQSGVMLSLDLKPALDEKTLDARLLREFEERKNQDLKNVMRALLPDRLNTYVLSFAGLSSEKKVNSVTKEERAKLINALGNLTFTVTGPAGFNEAVITSGGVEIKELTPQCESRMCDGLYFIGETIDADALTGGFNLQIAWATAVIAAKSVLAKQS